MHWVVVHTHPQAERKALTNLEQQDFKCYLPMLQEHKKISVMFPRYLFVWIEDQWRSLLGTSGVAAVLLDCGKPAPLPANFVDGLKAKENKNGCVYLPRYRYRKGQTVQITGGVFSGLFGMYQGSCSHDREVVLLNVLGRVELASSDLF